MTKFFDEIFGFFTDTIWGWLEEFVKWVFGWGEIAALETGSKTLDMIVGYITGFLDFEAQKSAITGLFAALPSDVIAIMSLLQIQASISIIMAAYATKILMKIAVKVA